MIIDGDTFRDQEGNRVRLLGIDAPEKGEPFYRQASEKLTSLITKEPLLLKSGSRAYDRYGRILAFVYIETLLVNASLLEEGLARTYFFPEEFEDQELVEYLCAAQRRARAASRGIWSLPPPPAADRYFGNESSYRFHRPDCPSLKNADTLEFLRLLTRDEFLDRCFSPCRNCKP
ncbi:MAG: thermonuclease family protein [candidate division Zixibacteria bacterium]|nr:thermonuclease family protein [candidate division Zixibacteria bacterium]